MRTAAIALIFAATTFAQDTTDRLAGRDLINREVKAKLADVGLKAGARASDSEFLRRAYLDIVGSVPPLEHVERFLADKADDKRARVVDALLASGAYADNWSWIWANALVAGGDDQRADAAVIQVSRELKDHFAKGATMDQFATTLITATGKFERRQGGGGPMGGMMDDKVEDGEGLSLLYFGWSRTAGRDFPMHLANKWSRLFLGMQISCAQCHDHPFDKWTQEDFYGMAAFFTQVNVRPLVKDGQRQPYGYEIVDRPNPRMRGGLQIPDTKKSVSPQYLDTKEKPAAGKNMRDEFARLLTAKTNAQFARGVVNRYWGYLFGRGLVNPVDDFNGRNKPSHPELLEGLAASFTEKGFDVKWLIREICMSDAYQTSSRAKERTADQEKYYAIAAIRPLTPEQIMNSVIVAGMKDPSSVDRLQRFQALREFRFTFADDEGAALVEFDGTIPAALLMMNSQIVSRVTGAAMGGFRQRPGAPKRPDGTRVQEIWNERKTDEERVRAVYLAALSRPPSGPELARGMKFVRARGEDGLEDVMWTLLNSSEFLFNH